MMAHPDRDMAGADAAADRGIVAGPAALGQVDLGPGMGRAASGLRVPALQIAAYKTRRIAIDASSNLA